MFQQFTVKSQRQLSAARIAAVRAEMHKHRLDGFLVPHADEHQSEYLPENAERLAWLTGFTGSAGFAVLTTQRCVLFVDGRYSLQASQQIDSAVTEIDSLIDNPPSKWFATNVSAGQRIGFDPWLLTISQRREFAKALKKAGAELVQVENLIDACWHDRPADPQGRVIPHPEIHTGKSAALKLAQLGDAIAEAGADAFVMGDLTCIAWTFNIRGADVTHIPVTQAYAILRAAERPLLFIEQSKLEPEARSALEAVCDLYSPPTLAGELARLSIDKRIGCDPFGTSAAIAGLIEKAGGEIVEMRDPVLLPRAIKNDSEIAGSRAAHRRDGVAMARYLRWLDTQPPASLDEIAAATALEEIRRQTATRMNSELAEISFDTISGAGANGAIVHYRVTTETNARLEPGSLYLSDSGAQYADGTTDITRTIAIGAAPPNAARDFTLVLKGHIAIATARFPAGTRGMDLDPLARQFLWKAGKDYGHGTGHGVGAYLSVHEGPQSISKRGAEPLKTGMILSNEPGFYVEGQYGIRIENLVLVRDCADYPGFLEFETLTLAPIDRRLIDISLLDAHERDWLNAYHARVFDTVAPSLEHADSDWLRQACAPV